MPAPPPLRPRPRRNRKAADREEHHPSACRQVWINERSSRNAAFQEAFEFRPAQAGQTVEAILDVSGYEEDILIDNGDIPVLKGSSIIESSPFAQNLRYRSGLGAAVVADPSKHGGVIGEPSDCFAARLFLGRSRW